MNTEVRFVNNDDGTVKLTTQEKQARNKRHDNHIQQIKKHVQKLATDFRGANLTVVIESALSNNFPVVACRHHSNDTVWQRALVGAVQKAMLEKTVYSDRAFAGLVAPLSVDAAGLANVIAEAELRGVLASNQVADILQIADEMVNGVEKAKKRPPPSRFAALRRGVTSAMPIRASSEDGEDNAGDGSDVVNNADEVSSEELDEDIEALNSTAAGDDEDIWHSRAPAAGGGSVDELENDEVVLAGTFEGTAADLNLQAPAPGALEETQPTSGDSRGPALAAEPALEVAPQSNMGTMMPPQLRETTAVGAVIDAPPPAAAAAAQRISATASAQPPAVAPSASLQAIRPIRARVPNKLHEQYVTGERLNGDEGQAKRQKVSAKAETLSPEEESMLKDCILLAHKEMFQANNGSTTRIAGYVKKAREYFLAKFPVGTHPEASQRLHRILPDAQAINNRMKNLFPGSTASFPHVIAFENDKAAAEAAKALVEKNVDGLGLDAPGVNNPTGKECKTWIVNFMDTKMKQNDDGQWIFLVAGITRATVQALHTRVQLWKSKPDSASYQSHYTKFQASLLNAVRALPV